MRADTHGACASGVNALFSRPMEGKENKKVGAIEMRKAVKSEKAEEAPEAKPGLGHQQKVPNPVEWLPVLISSKSFFQPCAKCTKGPMYNAESHKAVTNFLCLTCAKPEGLCALCTHEHANHHILQIRRSSYHDVVRERELSKLINTNGIQTYIINSSQVVFLRERPQSRGKSGSGGSRPASGNDLSGGCLSCGRHLHEGLSYCSLGCKVKHCTRGAPIGKRLPPGLELHSKPRDLNYYVDFMPRTPQQKSPRSPSQGNKRRRGGAKGGDSGQYTSPHSPGSPPRHRRKKTVPRPSPYK